MRILKLSFVLLAFVTVFSACDDDTPAPAAQDYGTVISNVTNNVIVATYGELSAKAAALHAEVQDLRQNPTNSNLDEARQAWRDTRSPWEQSEGFLFGPVDTKGIDPAIDSWPVNVVDLDNILASGDDLTVAFITNLEGTSKGFHTIEYLLWGTDGNKVVANFTDREYEYLLSCTEVLANDTKTLHESWTSAGDNFADNLLNAGASGSIYVSQKSVLEELTQGMITIADEVANGKINDPLQQQDLTLEESQFSHNSKADFANNVRSIKNVYLGRFAIGTEGVQSVVAEKNASLDTRFQEEIDAAISAIENIPGTFSDAVINNSSTVADAQSKVAKIQTTLEEDILPLISNL